MNRVRVAVPPLLVAALIVLLGVLATLQYNWIGRLSQAERERAQAGLEHAAGRFTEDFDRELVRAIVTFAPPERPGVERWLVDRLEWWRAEAPYPGLVAELAVVRRRAGGMAVRCLAAGADAFSDCPLPATFQPLAGPLEMGEPLPPLPEDTSGLVLGPRHRGSRTEDDRPELLVLVRLDLGYAAEHVLPELAAAYLGATDGMRYAAIVREAGGAELFRTASAPEGGLLPNRADVVRPFFAVRPFSLLPGRGRTPREGEGRETAVGPQPARRDERAPAAAAGGRWLLLLSHPSGSLETAVSRARARNLGIGLGVLALLGASSILLLVLTQRAQRLARQQLEFVAAVSHELRTPLTAIHSAGQNLADGVITEEAQVRRYGAMIEHEGRRLSQIVGRVLTFAGIRSGQRVYTMSPIDVTALLAQVLADARLALEEKRVTVETDIPAALPPVRGDAAALREALANLLDNAIKFSPSERWAAVRARVVGGERAMVEIEVADRGIGIPRGELSRVLEPFARGSGAAAVPGSGLGLAVVSHVVEAHDGHLAIHSELGRGTVVTLRLPAAEATA